MSICSITCILCESKDVYPINFSGIHKACIKHLNDLTYYNDHSQIPSPIISCIWCETKVIIIWDICRCISCYETTCMTRKCEHKSCMKGNLKCPECSECIKCGNYDENLQNNICSNCSNMPTCPQCQNKAVIYKKACDHFACVNCYHKQDCKLCNNIKKCDYCQNPCTNMFVYNCHHSKCENCYLDSCSLCMEEKLNTFPPCDNCGEKAESHVKFCSHIGCTMCKDDCKKCNPICSNCKNATVPDIIMKCGHYGCVKCSEIFCYKCWEYISKIQIEVPEYKERKLKEAEKENLNPCVNCGRKENPTTLFCSHAGCLKCCYEKKCRECDKNKSVIQKPFNNLEKIVSKPIIDFPECENCGEKNELLLKVCRHLGCVKCREYCNKCGSKCTNCHTSGFCDKKMPCGHFGCKTCSETYCYTCAKYIHEMSSPIKPQKYIKPCLNCGEQLEEIILACNHKGCIGCYKSKQCKKCFPTQQKCENCFKLAKITFKAKCGHASCENCIDLYCSKCSNLAPTPETCPNCKKKTELITLDCMHKLCENCSYNKSCCLCNTKKISSCANCHKLYCELIRFSCNHNGCENCNLQGCFLCSSPSKKTKQTPCKNCNKISDIGLMKCGHMGCNDCERLLSCKFCIAYKGCPNCQSLSYKRIELNCGHKGCQGCEDRLCNTCEKELKDKLINKCTVCCEEEGEVNLNCGHLGCRKCSVDNTKCQSCDKLTSYICENCKANKNDTKLLPCKHRLCKICNNFLKCCPMCFPTKASKKLCSICKKVANDLTICRNKHEICVKCSETYKDCPKCPKKCLFCSREIQASLKLNCSVHYTCKSCLDINKVCKICQTICCSCKIITEHYLLLSCNHAQCPLCLQNRKTCIICNPPSPQTSTLLSRNSSTNYEQCSCCLNKLYHYKTLPCSHKACESCHNLSKKCTKCSTTFIKKETKCEHCNLEPANIDTNCNHKICFSCFDTNKICPNIKLCNSCNENPATEYGKCGHGVCKNCIERTGNCGACRLKISNNKCPHCFRTATSLLLFKCKHDGCSCCLNNGFCFSCVATRKMFNNDQVGIICYKCQDLSNNYVMLMCNHRLCSKCFVEDYKNFGFMCPECALGSLEAVCVLCKEYTSWEIDGDIVRSSGCCRRIFCKKCCGEIRANKVHECS
ncbi:hypothetical protein SteCoe_22023 [Stentor coeruleus]|uniref:RING-type domain-containing protein n=1 Tax=Stentor coeruleus TaxID=5963 RepID=A0A1R2BND8_9CILI|nr:hypothetical protein SteCoe_22023 [Stentor coeruleus]